MKPSSDSTDDAGDAVACGIARGARGWLLAIAVAARTSFAMPLACRAVIAPAVLALASLVAPPVIADPLAGEQIFREQCASCHGERGEGTAEGYPQPISDDRTLAQMARFIARTMPPDAADKCTSEDAQAVSVYIQQKFLTTSPEERSRRIELVHLTVNQYRHAIAELLASLRGTARWDEKRGLRGYYNAIDEKGDGKQVLERIDPEIKFDFGVSSPLPDKIDPRVFSISWFGSVQAPHTGQYEFIVRTENSARLYVNNRLQPLVDAWIKSGDDKEYRATIRLLGGRAYPLTLHLTKAGQGVRTPNQANTPVPPASIHLAWKPPGRLEETIPQARLSPIETPETLIVETPFPPDDRSTGFERGTSITKEWDQATTEAAIEVADYVRGRLRDFAGVPTLSPENAPQIREFCARFAERAFRSPLTPQQRTTYIDTPLASTPDVEAGVERVVLMVLKSPWFLYREVGRTPAPQSHTASRLSLVLWDAPPDAELLAMVAAGKLATRDDIAAQAHRMIADPRFEAKLKEFFLQWMKLERDRGLNKDPERFSGFDASVETELRTSLEMFLEELIRSDNADFRQLFLSDVLYLNGRLAKIYAVDLPGDAPFQKVQMPAGDRAGILSHPYLLAAFADTKDSSPIRRGVFLARSVLGRTLRPPPDAVAPLPAELHPDLSTRERVDLQTSSTACRSCHALINPLGFSLERYDAIGRIRNLEGNRPVDASGWYVELAGEQVRFQGARELGVFLAGSDEAHAAFVEKLFYYFVKQPIRVVGPQARDQLIASFVQHDFNVRTLLEEIATVAALSAREADSNPAPSED